MVNNGTKIQVFRKIHRVFHSFAPNGEKSKTPLFLQIKVLKIPKKLQQALDKTLKFVYNK